MIDLQKMAGEFVDWELDPGKIGTEKLLRNLLNVKQTIDLSSMEKARTMNSFLSSMFEIIGTKAGICHYYERLLDDSLKAKRLEVKLSIPDRGTLTKEDLLDRVESNEEIKTLANKLSTASASRFFWSHLLDVLREISKRVDSSSASLGVESKLKNIGS